MITLVNKEGRLESRIKTPKVSKNGQGAFQALVSIVWAGTHGHSVHVKRVKDDAAKSTFGDRTADIMTTLSASDTSVSE